MVGRGAAKKALLLTFQLPDQVKDFTGIIDPYEFMLFYIINSNMPIFAPQVDGHSAKSLLFQFPVDFMPQSFSFTGLTRC
jgi:hypothetical protein